MPQPHHTHRRARSRMNVLTSCISTTLVLVLLGAVVLFMTLAHNFSHNLRENFTVLLLLDDDISNRQTVDLQKRLEALPCTRQLTYISKEQARIEQTQALGIDPASFVENVLPASFELGLKAEYANNDSLQGIIEQLQNEKQIMEVNYPESLMESLNDNIRKISTVLIVVAVLLMLVSFELINNTILLWIHARRFLIHTMTLVGASWSFIRRPFLTMAFWIGFASALAATVILGTGVYAMAEYDVQLQQLLTWQVPAFTLGAVFVCGILLTLLCAFISVNRCLSLSYDKLNRY